MRFRVGDIVSGDDIYDITHSKSTLKVVALFDAGKIKVEVLDSPGFPNQRGKRYGIYEKYARLITPYDPREDIHRKIATIYKRYEERNR